MRTKNSVVNTVQDETIFCIIGGTPIYVDVVLELRRERRINVGRTCLFFQNNGYLFPPPPTSYRLFEPPSFRTNQYQSFPQKVSAQPDPEFVYVISGSSYINSLRRSGYFIPNQFPLTPWNRVFFVASNSTSRKGISTHIMRPKGLLRLSRETATNPVHVLHLIS